MGHQGQAWTIITTLLLSTIIVIPSAKNKEAVIN